MPSQGRRKQIEPRTRNQRIHRNHDNGSETTDLDGHQGVLSHRGACQHHQLCGLSYFLHGFILKHFKVYHRYSLTHKTPYSGEAEALSFAQYRVYMD